MTDEHLRAITTPIQDAMSENRLVFCFYHHPSDIERVCRAEGSGLQMPEPCTVESFALQVTVPERVPHLHFSFSHERPLELFCVQLDAHLSWMKRHWPRVELPFRRPVVWLHESAFLLLFRMRWRMDLRGALAVHVKEGVCLPAEDYLYVQDKSMGRRPRFPDELWMPELLDLGRRQLGQDLPPLTRAYLAQRQWTWEDDPRQQAELWLEAFQAYGQWQDTGNAAVRKWWRSILAGAHDYALLTLDDATEVARTIYTALLEGPARNPAKAFALVVSLLEQAKASGREKEVLPFYFDLMEWASRQPHPEPARVENPDDEDDIEPIKDDLTAGMEQLFLQAAPLLEEQHLLEHARRVEGWIDAALLQGNRPVKARRQRHIQRTLQLGSAVLKGLIHLGSHKQVQQGQQLIDFARTHNAQDRLLSRLEEDGVPLLESWSGEKNLPLVLLTEAIEQLKAELEGPFRNFHLSQLGRLYEKRASHQPSRDLRHFDLREAIGCAWEEQHSRDHRDQQHLGGGLRGWKNIRVARFHFELGELRDALFLVNIGIQEMWVISQSYDHGPEGMKEHLREHLHFRLQIVQKLLEENPADQTDLERIVRDSHQILDWLDHHEMVRDLGY
ncbi:hypothetical protein [Deinococcus cellulosilyticus]|uniref:Uncharacterized protein n=1 Tax=Deinococcus cellulosilyticus (strain DSM 18568 / NBRC 106333 / KACC 11606 / 5516J-15) TaxID=1223518 RepID=A0A511N6B0_DEIC1|nr:hypothetical protein [Deinococcus cellulosilyticus]GEM48412.1 hypothetical protein DC3_40470 [Deinococcus cellulosilyticus NBRC 106333 = KACC 11606]